MEKSKKGKIYHRSIVLKIKNDRERGIKKGIDTLFKEIKLNGFLQWAVHTCNYC